MATQLEIHTDYCPALQQEKLEFYNSIPDNGKPAFEDTLLIKVLFMVTLYIEDTSELNGVEKFVVSKNVPEEEEDWDAFLRNTIIHHFMCPGCISDIKLEVELDHEEVMIVKVVKLIENMEVEEHGCNSAI